MEESKTMEQVIEEQMNSIKNDEVTSSQMTNSMYLSEASTDDKDSDNDNHSEDEHEETEETEENVESDSEEESEEDSEEEEKEGEEEEEKNSDVEDFETHKDTYVTSALIEHHYRFPFPITCTFSILMLIYTYQLFRMLCEAFGGGCNENCICFSKRP